MAEAMLADGSGLDTQRNAASQRRWRQKQARAGAKTGAERKAIVKKQRGQQMRQGGMAEVLGVGASGGGFGRRSPKTGKLVAGAPGTGVGGGKTAGKRRKKQGAKRMAEGMARSANRKR